MGGLTIVSGLLAIVFLPSREIQSDFDQVARKKQYLKSKKGVGKSIGEVESNVGLAKFKDKKT